MTALIDPTDIKPPKSAVPALGMSIQVDLGAGRVCTLQTFVSSDCKQVELNQMLDKLTSAGARQRAAYKIEELERDIEKLQKEHDQQVEDVAKLDEDHAAAQAKRTQDGADGLKAADDFEVKAKDAWESGGRRGPFKLSQQNETYVKRVREGVDKVKAEIAAAEEEHKRVRGEIQKTMTRREEVIGKARAELARCKEIVNAGLKE